MNAPSLDFGIITHRVDAAHKEFIPGWVFHSREFGNGRCDSRDSRMPENYAECGVIGVGRPTKIRWLSALSTPERTLTSPTQYLRPTIPIGSTRRIVFMHTGIMCGNWELGTVVVELSGIRRPTYLCN